jgi:hypothetical protein
MTKEEIISGSKLIAEYLGWVYIPFNDLQGFPKAGWWKCIPKVQDIQKSTVYSFDGEKEEVKELNLDLNLFRYNNKNGWKAIGEEYCKYICRTHGDLRFWNSWDALIPVIEKIEKDFKVKFHINNGGCEVRVDKEWRYSNFKTELTWLQNTFNIVVKILENYGKKEF